VEIYKKYRMDIIQFILFFYYYVIHLILKG